MSSRVKVIICERNPAVVAELASRLLRAGKELIAALDPTTRDLSPYLLNTADVVLIGADLFIWLHRKDPDKLAAISRHCVIVVMLRSEQVLDVISAEERVGGFIFLDLTLQMASEAIDLALYRHCLMPRDMIPYLVQSRLRVDLLPSLTPIERRTLGLLGQAHTNRSIAEILRLPESNVKTLVRSLLTKLRFQNRTEAAVFAARQGVTPELRDRPEAGTIAQTLEE